MSTGPARAYVRTLYDPVVMREVNGHVEAKIGPGDCQVDITVYWEARKYEHRQGARVRRAEDVRAIARVLARALGTHLADEDAGE